MSEQAAREWQQAWLDSQIVELPPYILAMIERGNKHDFRVKAESIVRHDDGEHDAWRVAISRQAENGRWWVVSRVFADLMFTDFGGDTQDLAEYFMDKMVAEWRHATGEGWGDG